LLASLLKMNLNHILQISNFLPKEERDTIFNTICTHQNAFQYLGTPDPNGGGSLHLPSSLETVDTPETKKIRKACELLSNRIINRLPEIFSRLNIEPFPVSQIPLSIMNGLDGHTGAVHTDESGGRFKISLLYYLHKTPKAFQGGALQLFETNTDAQNGYCEEPFASIEHEDNLLIAFASKTYHGVTDVSMDSTTFEDGRFVIVGFLE